jgi:hypothetical protein
VRRHLSRPEAVAAVRGAAGVGQFLGFGEAVDGQRTLRYVIVSGVRPVKVFARHVYDVGGGVFADLAEFPDVTEWDPMDDDGNYLGPDPGCPPRAWVNYRGASARARVVSTGSPGVRCSAVRTGFLTGRR